MNATVNIGLKTGSQKEYGSFLTAAGISYRVHGSFLASGKADFDGRWVICLSLCLRDTEQILAVVLPVLKEYGVPFLLIKDQLQHNRINNHAFPVHLFGKPLILFPEDVPQAIQLAAELAKVTDGFEGIRLPGCIRLGSIVYAVYAQLNPAYTEGETEKLPFQFSLEAGPSPFPLEKLRKEKKLKRFINRRYLPVSLIASSHKGNILKGLDLKTLDWCFIKQANAWAGEDFHGRQMRDRLQWQQEVANAVGEWVRAPEVLAVADQDGYSYLITEYIAGKTLESCILADNVQDKHPQQLLVYFHDLLLFVANMHQLGFVHRDLTAKNVLIKEGKIYLTDFELAYRLGNTDAPAYANGTIGYMSPQQKRNELPTIEEDSYSLGALLYYILSKEHPKELHALNEEQREAKLRALDCPQSLTDAIKGCLAALPEDRWDPDQLISTIETFLPTAKELKATARKKTWIGIMRKLTYAGILGLLAGITVLILWLASDEPNSRDNGFDRNYLSENMVIVGEYALPRDVRYLAGQINDSLHFSTGKPGEVLSLDLVSRRSQRRYLITDPAIRKKLNVSNMLEANQYGFMLYDGANRLIVEIPMGASPIYHPVSHVYTRATRLSEHTLLLRKFKPGVRDQYLYRYDLRSHTVSRETRLTDPVHDGGLATEGMLNLDAQQGIGSYVTRYANRIILFDTSLHIQAHNHTLDTFQRYTVQSRALSGRKGDKVTNAGPALFVNHAIALHGSLLFVNSFIKADNETADQFRESNVIDLYRIAAGGSGSTYMGSLRIPTSDKNRIRNFMIMPEGLVVLTPGLLRIYHLPQEVLKSFES